MLNLDRICEKMALHLPTGYPHEQTSQMMKKRLDALFTRWSGVIILSCVLLFSDIKSSPCWSLFPGLISPGTVDDHSSAEE